MIVKMLKIGGGTLFMEFLPQGGLTGTHISNISEPMKNISTSQAV